VNLSPGLQGISEATKIDVPDLIANYLYEAAKKYHGEAAHTGLGLTSTVGLSPYAKTIVTNVKMNRNRIVLPEVITNLSGLGKDDDILITAEKNCVVVSKSKSVEK
jgi:hypothetical protein